MVDGARAPVYEQHQHQMTAQFLLVPRSHAADASPARTQPPAGHTQRLAFTSMASGALAAGEPSGGGLHSSSGLHSLKSLTNLQSLQLNAWDAAPLLEAVPSAPATLKDLELHLSGDNWQSSVLDKVATQLGQQVRECQGVWCPSAGVAAAAGGVFRHSQPPRSPLGCIAAQAAAWLCVDTRAHTRVTAAAQLRHARRLATAPAAAPDVLTTRTACLAPDTHATRHAPTTPGEPAVLPGAALQPRKRVRGHRTHGVAVPPDIAHQPAHGPQPRGCLPAQQPAGVPAPARVPRGPGPPAVPRHLHGGRTLRSAAQQRVLRAAARHP